MVTFVQKEDREKFIKEISDKAKRDSNITFVVLVDVEKFNDYAFVDGAILAPRIEDITDNPLNDNAEIVIDIAEAPEFEKNALWSIADKMTNSVYIITDNKEVLHGLADDTRESVLSYTPFKKLR